MMNSSSDSSITVTPSDLTDEVATNVRRSSWHDLRLDMIGVFVIGFVLGSGGSQVVAWITSWELSSPKFLAFGVTFGTLGSLWMGAAEMRDLWRLRGELSNGQCEIVRITPKVAYHAHLGDDVPAIAFDGGSQTLVIVGNWWIRTLASGRVNWIKSGTQTRFPSTDFSITRLPLTGRVIAVEVNGSKLKVEPDDPEDPTMRWIETEQSIDQDCFIIDKPLQDVLRTTPPKSSLYSSSTP